MCFKVKYFLFTMQRSLDCVGMDYRILEQLDISQNSVEDLAEVGKWIAVIFNYIVVLQHYFVLLSEFNHVVIFITCDQVLLFYRSTVKW